VSGNEDAHLVKRFNEGDEKAFDQIFDKYRAPIYSICYRYTRNDADARDLSQEVFIKVFRNLKNFKGRSKLFTWVYRITVNTCISFKRREKHTQPLHEASTRRDPVGENARLKVAIADALERLPKRQRMSFILRHYEGHTFAEIGEIMGITTGAAKANHHQAIRKLRVYLKGLL
jgi:RNA polymerase sigma-70 factor (ECF subfamily)